MDFPRWKKTLTFLLNSAERVMDVSKKAAFSAGVLSLASNQHVGSPWSQANELLAPNTEIKKYFGKYLLKPSPRSSLSALMIQHRSHSSHSSHRSHSSHSSHYSSSSPSHSSGAVSPTPKASPPPAPVRRATIESSDDFSDTSGGVTKWSAGSLTSGAASFDPSVPLSKKNGRLEIRPRSAVTGKHYNGYISAARWDMSGKAASIEVLQTTTETANTIFALVADSNNWYRFTAEGNTLYFQSSVTAETTSASTPYNQFQHRFWRFRHDLKSKLIFWETSSDGNTWTVRHAINADIPVSRLQVELSAGTYRTVSSPGTAIFDNFRIVTIE